LRLKEALSVTISLAGPAKCLMLFRFRNTPAVGLICAIAFYTGSKPPRRMADGACNSAASPIVFFRNSDQQIETDHGRFMDG
jgi:hypothetical protein